MIGWIVLGVLVLVAIYVISIYNRLVSTPADERGSMERHRRAAEAPRRPRPQPDRDREGLCEP